MNVARRMRWILLAGSLPAAARPFSVPPTTKHARRFDSLRRLSAHRENQQHHDDDGGKDSSSFGLYVHIPYCRRRCNYCDFAIVPIGGDPKKDDDIRSKSRTDGFERMDANYRNALLDEIATIGKTSSSSSSPTTGEKIRLRSVYFGGGTPSLAPLSTLRQILHALLRSDDAPFRLEGDDDDDRAYEATIEMDPGTFDLDYLVGIREMGFNRISLGVQSFDDDLLATMGRVHRSTDVRRSVEMIGEVFGEGSANYSIDLISGVPGLTLAGWAETLYEAARLRPRPTHMSLYDLQVERGTTFGKWYGDTQREEERVIIPVTTRGHDDDTTHSTASRRHPVLPSAEDCAFMYSYASGYLRSKDYEHYEISSYAYGGGEEGFGASDSSCHRAMHNQIYWQYDGQWYAVGLGATSNVDGVRFPRPRALSDYISWTESLSRDYFPEISGDGCDEGDDTRVPPWLRGEVTNANEGTDDEDDDDDDGLLDIVMTRLRTSEGLDLDWVAGRNEYGTSHVEAILRGFGLALELGLGAREDDDDDADRRPRERNRHGRIRLNDPKGFLFSNNIISNIFVELSEMDS